MAEVTTAENRAESKVTLDTEGAAYLEEKFPAPAEETAPAEQPVPDTSAEEEAAQAAALAKKKKRKIMIIAAAAALLTVCAAAAYFLLFSKPDVPTEPVPEPPKPEVIVVPSTPEKPPLPPGMLIPFEPFWLEKPVDKEKSVFITVQFSIYTRDPDMSKEMERNKMQLRDAIYFYLKNKDLAFLTSAQNLEEIKKELALVMDNYLRTGHIEDMLFECFLSR